MLKGQAVQTCLTLQHGTGLGSLRCPPGKNQSTCITFQKSEDMKFCYFSSRHSYPEYVFQAPLLPDTHSVLFACQVSTWNFSLGRVDPESMCNFCSISRIMLAKWCTYNCNRTLRLHLYTYIYDYMFRGWVTVSSLLVAWILFIFQNSNVLDISRIRWSTSAEGCMT